MQAGQIAGKRQPDGYTPQIRRTLVIGDELWVLSETGMQAASLSTLDPIASVTF